MLKPNLRAVRGQFGSRKTAGKDVAAGTVLGVQSVPNALATAILANVNPVLGIYAYIFGITGGILATSSVLMVVEVTSAMAVVMADIEQLHTGDNQGAALAMLALMTGGIMLLLGLLKMGRIVRFVPASVMTGFVSGVAINIILAQFGSFTGYSASGGNKIEKAYETFRHITSWEWQSVVVGVVTIVLIVGLGRTRIGPLGMVVAVIVGSAMVPIFGWSNVELVSSVSAVPNSLPGPALPDFSLFGSLIVPALSLTFIGLVQGAAISTSIPNPDGEYPDASGDFRGQGVGSIAAGVFQGMPVAGSMSGTAVNLMAGAKSRLAPLIAVVIIVIGVLFLSDLISAVAMPVLAGLLLVVGWKILKPREIAEVWRTGATSAVVMIGTFVLTLIVPLQYAVLVGVGVSIMLYVFKQSEGVEIKRWVFGDHVLPTEIDPPEKLKQNEIVLLVPYGSLFFAAAPAFIEQMPEVPPDADRCVVILFMRDKPIVENTFLSLLRRYHKQLDEHDCVLKLAGVQDKVFQQLQKTGALADFGHENVYRATERVGESVSRALDDAERWVTHTKP